MGSPLHFYEIRKFDEKRDSEANRNFYTTISIIVINHTVTTTKLYR